MYSDVTVLATIAEHPDVELKQLLQTTVTDNGGCTAVKLLNKVVEE